MITDFDPVVQAKALVVVPVFNEAVNVINLINAIRKLPTTLSVLIVDDQSPDGTGALVKEHPNFGEGVFLLTRESPRGFAGACRDGFRWGLDQGYEVCVQMDADFSHDPADIPRLLGAVHSGADVAVGSRYVDGIRVINWPARRLLISLFAGLYTRLLSGLRLSDPTSGFKAIHNRVLRALDWSQFTAEGYGFIIEMHFHTARCGFQISEVPIVFTERRRGASKMSYKIMAESAFRVLKLGCYRLFHRKKTRDLTDSPSLEFA